MGRKPKERPENGEAEVLESTGRERLTEEPEAPTGTGLSELQAEHDREVEPEKRKRRRKKKPEVQELDVSFEKEQAAALFEDIVVDLSNGLSTGLLNQQPLVPYEEHMAKVVTRANIMTLTEDDLKKAPGIAALIVAGVIFVPRLLAFLEERKAKRSTPVETA
jgi:hypothetical protein